MTSTTDIDNEAKGEIWRKYVYSKNVGAIWIKKERMNIHIDDVGNFIALKNKFKKKETHPDYKLFRKEDWLKAIEICRSMG